MLLRVDKLGVVIAGLLISAEFAMPLATFRANRIAVGQAKFVLDAMPLGTAVVLTAVVLVAAGIAVFGRAAWPRLIAATVALAVLALCMGACAGHLTPAASRYARVAPGSGFWVMVFALAILFADAAVRLRLGPLARLLTLALAAAAVAVLLTSGVWSELSILKEYAARADVFWREAGNHVMLAVGSLAAAIVVGLPLGILAHRLPRLRGAVLSVLNILQTIPSIALFGMLIGPLGWVAAHVPGAAEIGIRGIGAAPAFVALFLYSLLPMVANTVVGLKQVPSDVVDAASGMGMTGPQRLFLIELPLAFSVILTGIRIVLVQNIGLATIAALIGGGGLGVFVFQGIGQTATDLILLGAVPTVALAFAAAVLLDATVELTSRPHA
jgi:osmoprotectant transport system permease protein